MITRRKERLKPYPRPDYKDEHLLVKEMINGSYWLAIKEQTNTGLSPLKRYDMDFDSFLLANTIHRKVEPEDFTMSLQRYDLAKLKEIGWLPYYEEEGREATLEIVYNPKEFYDTVTIEDVNDDIAFDSGENIYCRLNVPYFDEDNAGLYGIAKDKDDDSKSVSVWFFSLKDYTFKKLGDIPADLQDKYAVPIVYIEGAVVIRFEVDYDTKHYTYLSFGFDGSVNRLDNQNGGEMPLADFGRIVIRSNEKTEQGEYRHYAYSASLEPTGEYYDEDVVGIGIFELISYNKYGYGNKIGKAIYMPYGETQSRKWKMVDGTLSQKVIDSRAWKYKHRTLYDYHTPNRYFDALKPKAMRYNFIKNGIFAPGVRYPIADGQRCGYQSFDEYGEFVVVKTSDGSKKVYHAYDFKTWQELPPIQGGLNIPGRLWINGRSDDIVGLYGSPFYAVIDASSARFRFGGYALRRTR